MRLFARHPFVRSAAVGAGVLAGTAAVTLITWNSFAPDLFGLDPLRFKQALGLTVFGLIAGRLLAPHQSRYSEHLRSPKSHQE
jgi:hypothetical protein